VKSALAGSPDYAGPLRLRSGLGLRPAAETMTVCCAAIFAPRGIKELRPSADWDWVWDWDWVTQGPPKRHARVAQASNSGSALFATKVKKGAGGIEEL